MLVKRSATLTTAASRSALNYQQLLQSSLLSARKRQETSLRFLIVMFGFMLLTNLQFNTESDYQASAEIMCVMAIVLSLFNPWFTGQTNRIANAFKQQQINGELLVTLLTGVLLTPAILLAVFVSAAPHHWVPVITLAIAILGIASISDAHPMRMIFLVSPVVLAIVTSLSWAGESLDLLLALTTTVTVFAAVIWLRQRHRNLVTSLVARVNEQMIPIRLERLVAAQKRELEQLALANRVEWQDLRQAAQSMASLTHQLESTGTGGANNSPNNNARNNARILAKTSKHLADQIHQHGRAADHGSAHGEPVQEWIDVTKLCDALRLRLAALTQCSGARLHLVPVAADIEAKPALVERILQNLILHSINDANAGSVSVQARFASQVLTITIEHDGERALQGLSVPDLASEGLPRALALASSASLPLRIEQSHQAGFTLTFEQWRKHPSRAILHPRMPMASSPDRHASVKCRTLLIDDDPLARMGLAALLENAGYDTLIWSGQSIDTIESELAEAQIDFIVSDWWLSKNANAIAMLKWVQERIPVPVPVVIVSGDQACLESTAISAQLDGITVRTLAKPVTPKTLARAISELIALDQNLKASDR